MYHQMTTPRRWHTPNPISPPYGGGHDEDTIGQEIHVPGEVSRDPAFADKIWDLQRLLHRHGNPHSTELGQASHGTLLREYEYTFGPDAVAPLLEQPHRHAYKMMAALAHEDDIRAWLAEWRQQGLDLGPFEKRGFFSVSPPKSARARHSAINHGALHHALDVRLPNGMVRHLHDTAVAGNRSSPLVLEGGFVDPYFGTGLDPSRLSGIVAPYRSSLAPRMACCGQELGPNGEIPPGCWIQLANTPKVDRVVPYQVWFQGMDAATTWTQIYDGVAQTTFVESIQTGTAFLDYAYYEELDRRIRALVVLVVPSIVDAQDAVTLLPSVPEDYSVAKRLSSEVKEQLRELVALIDRYNAPQMGTCFMGTLFNDAFIDEHIVFLREHRNAEIEFANEATLELPSGLDLPILRNFGEVANLKTTLDAIDDDRLDEIKETVERVLRKHNDLQLLIDTLEERENILLKFATFLRPLTVPKVLDPGPIPEYIRLVKEAQPVVLKFVTVYNAWRKTLSDDILKEFWQKYETLESKFREPLKRNFESAGFEKYADFVNALRSIDQGIPVNREKIIAYIAKSEFNGFADVPEVYLYAHFRLARPAIQKAISSLEPDWKQLEKQFLARAQAEVRKIQDERSVKEARRLQEAEEREAERRRRQDEADAEAARRLAAGEGGGEIQVEQGRENLRPMKINPMDPKRDTRKIDLRDWKMPLGLAFKDSSCTYDSLFAAMFAIPNQWFREEVLKAQQIFLQRGCDDKSAKDVDEAIVRTIDYFDERANLAKRFFDICPNWKAWKKCLPTGSAEEAGEKEDNPATLLGQLMAFYNIADGYTAFYQTYNKAWNPLRVDDYRSIKPAVQLYAVVAESKRFDIDNTRPYVVPEVKDDFTILSCLLYTRSGANSHWQACVRHPATSEWYRMLDTGEAKPLGLYPIDIRGQSEDKKDLYEPRAWFYVRTSALAGFPRRRQPLKEGVSSSSGDNLVIKEDETFLGANKDTELVRIFGRAYDPQYGSPLLSYDEKALRLRNETAVLGCMQLLRHLDKDIRRINTSKKVSPVFDEWNVQDGLTAEEIIYEVNGILIPVLRAMVQNRSIDGKSIAYRWTEFTEVAIRSGFLTKDTNVVPLWSIEPAEQSISPPQDWRTTKQERRYFVLLGDLWHLVLRYLFVLLKEDREDERQIRSAELRTVTMQINRAIEALTKPFNLPK